MTERTIRGRRQHRTEPRCPHGELDGACVVDGCPHRYGESFVGEFVLVSKRTVGEEFAEIRKRRRQVVG